MSFCCEKALAGKTFAEKLGPYLTISAYLTIPSLCTYLLVEQESPTVVVFRRTEHGFVREVYQGLDAVIPLREIDIELPLAEVYDALEFTPEPNEDEPA